MSKRMREPLGDGSAGPSEETKIEKRSHSLERYILPFLFVLLTFSYLAARFRAGNAFPAFFEDDFFYYLTVATNIAGGRGSTFDGIHLTNGYHPLWLVTNVLLALCFKGRSLYYALVGIMAASVFATYLAVAQCFSSYMTRRNAARCALLVAAQFALIMSGGMEIVLTVPLLAYLCVYRMRRFRWTIAHGLLYGLLASAVILARLDAILFIAMLAMLDLLAGGEEPWATRLKVAGAFLAGLVPVALYLAFNLLVFHMATPVSGAAKQLRTSHFPDTAALRIAVLGGWLPVVILSRPVLAGILWAAVLLAFRGKGNLLSRHLPVVWALMCFPLVQLGTLSILSDWPIWEWYFYPFVAAAVGVILVFSTRRERWLLPTGRYASGVCAVVGLCLLGKITVHDLRAATMRTHPMYDFYYAAGDIANFAKDHPGTYAMGDRAGLVGYMIHQPLIQLEGLMMDKPFLENIRQRRNLFEVLKQYKVRYYIATNPVAGPGPGGTECFAFREPVQAGSTSPVMRGKLCKQPILHFRYNGIQTYIFDVQ